MAKYHSQGTARWPITATHHSQGTAAASAASATHAPGAGAAHPAGGVAPAGGVQQSISPQVLTKAATGLFIALVIQIPAVSAMTRPPLMLSRRQIKFFVSMAAGQLVSLPESAAP